MSNSLKIIEIKDKGKLNDFVAGQKRAEFLQSWQWGEFQERAGNKIFRLGVEDEKGELIAVATLIKKSLGLKMNYFFCPRGPLAISDFRFPISDLYNFFFDEIKKLAKKEGAVFLRMEPDNQFQISNFKFKISKTIDIEPSKTLMLDFSKTEDELLAVMHQKTRYNIRLAEKKGVKVFESPLKRGVAEGQGVLIEDFEIFWKLMDETCRRDKIRSHGKEYYEKILATDENVFKLLVARLDDKILAAGIFSFFGDTAAYIYGASSNENREVMAPYLLQWEAIKIAKNAGFKYYDFYGVDEKKWPGVTRFKKGFSGEEINYAGTFDITIDIKKYLLYSFLRKLRRIF